MPTQPIWRAVTPDGHELFDAASALQKCVRRGLEEDALYWAKEMYLSEYPNFLWSRLFVIAVEDVGFGDSLALGYVKQCRDVAKEKLKSSPNLRGKEERSDRLFVVAAVLYLVRASKSRLIDTATIHTFEGGLARREVPDFALDGRTHRGKQLGRNEAYFWKESARLVNPALVPDIYQESARNIRIAARDGSETTEE